MSRTHASARKAGTEFERVVADYLAHNVDDRIDRRVKTGAKDRGDISGLRVHGQRVTVECKNTVKADLSGWVRQVAIERGNDDGLAGIVVHKRHGVAWPGDQFVTMTLDELVALLTARRDHVRD